MRFQDRTIRGEEKEDREVRAARAVFELAAPADSLARGIVAMEDGLGLQVVIGHPGLDNAAAERILLEHASAVTGTTLGDRAS